MARQFVELSEAAELLKISVEELSDMRSRNELYGYRDGKTWKFKYDEIERVASARGISLEGESTPTGDSNP